MLHAYMANMRRGRAKAKARGGGDDDDDDGSGGGGGGGGGGGAYSVTVSGIPIDPRFAAASASLQRSGADAKRQAMKEVCRWEEPPADADAAGGVDATGGSSAGWPSVEEEEKRPGGPRPVVCFLSSGNATAEVQRRLLYMF